ncbi:hypothetical protein PIB30_005005 [Stylosanthes scabra]|uniref:SWIM-type domain-containing protein n=1 Tax=Stylosanthes scabra TaxID=79078 RepID=A0ABU6Y2M8_9FABA|nr:hypothetical protein [Stylosanthes scabra]
MRMSLILDLLMETLKRIVRIIIIECIASDEVDVYVTQKYMWPGKRWSVEHDKAGQSFRCSCLRMESSSLPCVHVDVLTSGVTTIDVAVENGAAYKSRLGAFLQLCKGLARKDESDVNKCATFVLEERKKLE